MLDFSRRLSPPSMVRYLFWRAAGNKAELNLTLKTGTKIRHSATDYGSAYEIFVSEVYKPTRPIEKSQVRVIVDLGANVGFSLLYFLRAYPNARIFAFEPHPAHVERLRANLELNEAGDRVTLYPAAASNKAGRLPLLDCGMSSTLVGAASNGNSISVDVVDVLGALKDQRIDILKIDIEGAEYDILADERFPRLDVAAIAMEWHRNPKLSDEHAWLVERLAQSGYRTDDIFAEPHLGMLWAYRQTGDS